MKSIRLLIGIWVFGTVLALLVVQAVFVLDRVRSAAWAQVDEGLIEEIVESRALVGSPLLQRYIDAQTEGRTKWNEEFFDVRDARGGVVASSENVALEGLPNGAVEKETDDIRIWEAAHAESRSGHTRIRIAEGTSDGYRIRVARTLKRPQKQYWTLRRQLATGLLAIALIGAGVAWFVATRSLRPVRLISDRAQTLGAGGGGTLPRSGSGDELDQLAGVLNELLARIQDEVGRIRRMSADVGHAIRTPLTAMRGTLELLVGRSAGDAAVQLEGALEELDRLTRLVNELLLLEKVESNIVAHGSVGPVELEKLVGGVLELVDGLARERGICIDTSLEAVTVQGDSSQLRQAIANLLDNALRHTSDEGRIEVRLAHEGDRVELSVEDSGEGVAVQDLERVFERFYSTAERGTGLGLAIVSAVAVAHGGAAWARPGPGGFFVLSIQP